MSGSALAATLLLSLFDPSGDLGGDGSYRLPPSLSEAERLSLDLRSLEAFDDAGKLRLEVGFGGIANPLNSPAGFSVPYLDVFIKTRVGGQTTLADTGFRAPINSGWQYHLALTGFSQRLERQLGEDTRPSSVAGAAWPVQVQGSKLVIQTDLPAGKYGYWVMSRIYDPLSKGGFKLPSSASGPYDLYARLPQSSPVVDVLLEGDHRAIYTTREVPELGEVTDRRPLILLSVGGAALMVALVATWMVWRR